MDPDDAVLASFGEADWWQDLIPRIRGEGRFIIASTPRSMRSFAESARDVHANATVARAARRPLRGYGVGYWIDERGTWHEHHEAVDSEASTAHAVGRLMAKHGLQRFGAAPLAPLPGRG